MPRPFPWPVRRAWLLLATAAAAVLLAALPARAQIRPGDDLTPPRIYFDTAGGTSFSGTAATYAGAPVKVHLCDGLALDQTSVRVTLNGADVRTSVPVQGTPSTKCPDEVNLVLSGSVTLPLGTSTLAVHVCDQPAAPTNCVDATRTYTYTTSRPRVVAITPNQASYDSAAAALTVQWAAGASPLAPNTVTIRVNGILVGSAFTYTANTSTTATSAGGMQLVPGWNRVSASICDTAQVCSYTDSIRVYRGSIAPTVSITPAGARQAVAPLAATVSVQVPLYNVDRSSVVFTINGQRDATTFSQAATTAPATGDAQNYGGTLSLPLGETTLSVRACTVMGPCTTSETTFFRFTTTHAAPVVTAA